MPIEMKLKEKYRIYVKAKFGGKKRSSGNSGHAGKAMRRSKRCTVPGSACLRKAKK